jgi:patatin-like phospholipase/acyl hydrolase
MRFQILSLSGGGYLGLYTISVLADLEDRLAAPIASRFDLIAGTSVGGITAIGIANEVPASRIKEAFERNGTRIFSDRKAPRSAVAKLADVYRSLFSPKYDSGPLQDTIIDIIGADTLIGDLKHPCILAVARSVIRPTHSLMIQLGSTPFSSWISSFPASIFARSRMSLMTLCRCSPLC